MKITGTRSYIRVATDDKTAWFDGELGIDGFYAIANSMRWLPPHDHIEVTDFDRKQLILEIENDLKDNKYKVFFL